jgi:hypothetical protein
MPTTTTVPRRNVTRVRFPPPPLTRALEGFFSREGECDNAAELSDGEIETGFRRLLREQQRDDEGDEGE